MLKFLRKFFDYSYKTASEFFLSKELENVNYEIREAYERVRNLERKKEKLEIMVFGV